MKKIISLIVAGVILTACENLQASYSGNHVNSDYSKESGLTTNVNTSNATINYHKSSASTAQ